MLYASASSTAFYATLLLVAPRRECVTYTWAIYDTFDTLPLRHRFESHLCTREVEGVRDELLHANLPRLQQLNRRLVIPWPVPKAPFIRAFFGTDLPDRKHDLGCTKACLDECSSTPQRMYSTFNTRLRTCSIYHHIGALA